MEEAVRYGHRNCVEELLKYKEIDVNAVDKEGKTLLHLAIQTNKPELVEVLLSHKSINPNIAITSPTYEGYTPLHFAAMYSNVECLNLLLACQKIDPSLKTKTDLTALSIAEQSKSNKRDELNTILSRAMNKNVEL